MKRAESLTVPLVVLIAVSSWIVRFFQLFGLDSSKLNFLPKHNRIIYLLYAFCFAAVVICLVYSLCMRRKQRYIFYKQNRHLCAVLIMLSISFFVDFIHQCCNCFAYLHDSSFPDYKYLICIALSGLFALVSCFYVYMITLTIRGRNYDFKNLTFLHFAPCAWAFFRLVSAMTVLINAGTDSEMLLEMLFLISFTGFSLRFVSMVDRRKNELNTVFCFFTALCFYFSSLLSVPILLMLLTGNYDRLEPADFSVTTYLMVSVTMFSLLNSFKKYKE